MKRIFFYARLFLSFVRTSAIADLEFRANLAVKIFTDIIWYVAQISVFFVIYKHTDTIAGWSYDEVLCYQLILFLVDSLYMIFFHENLERIPDKVRTGELDLLLAKPINSQFVVSVQRISTAYILNFFLVTGLLIWAILRLPYDVPVHRVLGLVLILIPAVLIYYATRMLLTTNSLIFVRADAVGYLWFQIYRLAFRPHAMYPMWLRYLIFSVIPVGFMVSGPATILIKGVSYNLFFGAFFAAGLFMWMTTRYWRFALRFYASASS